MILSYFRRNVSILLSFLNIIFYLIIYSFYSFSLSSTVEVKSVYVRNVPTNMSASEIADEFKKFGKLKPDGVAIRTRKVWFLAYFL